MIAITVNVRISGGKSTVYPQNKGKSNDEKKVYCFLIQQSDFSKASQKIVFLHFWHNTNADLSHSSNKPSQQMLNVGGGLTGPLGSLKRPGFTEQQ